MQAPQRHDCAVAFCVDAKFFPYALFMIWQIAHLNPDRRFDFVIASDEDLSVPDWAKPHGIVMHRAGEPPAGAEVARFRGSMSTLMRIMLARELGDRYRRIIYMDSDMFVAGGDLGRLMEVDLGPHPIGAALDYCCFYPLARTPKEFAEMGWPAVPYFNSGFQVIDTKAYRDQEVERRSFEFCGIYKKPMPFGDQTLTNLALRGKFAQLAPCWNWQFDFQIPHLAHFYPVFHHHFIGKQKPQAVDSGLLSSRFNHAYRAFMERHMPEGLARLAPPAKPRLLTFGEQAGMIYRNLIFGKPAMDIIERHPDPYRAIL